MPRSPLTPLALLAAILLGGCPSSQEPALSPISCPAGLTRCLGTCVDLASNAGNCGGCGQSCGLGACAGGSCTCDAGTTVCTGLWPRCVNLSADASNCGGCGAVCPLTNDVCVSRTCQCPASLPTTCVDTCVDLTSDAKNCNGCGNACAAGASCVSSGCQCPIATPDVCGAAPGRCVDWLKDPTACGASCAVCASGASCSAGNCQCPASPSIVCGASPGTCCEGTGCCGGGTTCETKHANGLGQSFYDCYPLGTHTFATAVEAADAWSATGTSIDMSTTACPTDCYARSASGLGCAIWCYGTSVSAAGHVHLDSACTCPTDLNPAWN